MFLLTGSSRTSLASLRTNGFNVLGNGGSSNLTSNVTDPPSTPGNVNAYESLNHLLDCCILYYYAVAHKYLIMVIGCHQFRQSYIYPLSIFNVKIADLRDSIGTFSEILRETNETHEELQRTMETVSSDSMISSTHGNVLKDLHEKLSERKRVFLKRSTELARKQAWYRSVALGKHRRDLLCWMLRAILKTLKASFSSRILME